MGSVQPTNTLLFLAATEPSSWSIHLSSMCCWDDVLRCCPGKVVTFLGRHHSESVQFQQVVDYLESGCVELFLVRFRQLTIHHTTLVFLVWVPPRKIVSRYRTQPFLRLFQRSSSLVLSRRRHSRARLPVLSSQIRFSKGRTVK